MTQKRRWALSEDAKQRLTEWNLNTIIGGLTLVGSILVGGYFINDTRRDGIELKAAAAANLARDEAQDDAMARVRDAVNANSYRVGALEARGDRLENGLAQISGQINDQTGDLKVIKEILARLEKRQGGEP